MEKEQTTTFVTSLPLPPDHLPTSWLEAALQGQGLTYSFTLGNLPESDADCPESSTPSKGYCGGLEQSPSCLWSMPMADDGEQGQYVTQHRPSDTQQPDVPNIPVPTLLPRSDNKGPNGGLDLCDN
ncbi:hypothetical protein A4A49_15713 [Nicotiana attenuata]|uniref:Uncharacterized protein n=1 Tax=Nicotiana attenuata TaxID=49451 RepID=A0A1J6JMV3_NICAT|nr:hypothetical protein A4A49_15713 [Nicotiana attenuata]